MSHSTDPYANPWTTLSSKSIYQNPWIALREDAVIKPNGQNGIYGVVSFKNKAIGIVALDSDLQIVLVGQYRYPLQEYSWEIPEGGGPMHEEPLETAKRELKEETGLEAQTWTKIHRIHTSNSVTDEEGFIFMAENLTQGTTNWEDTEQLIIKKIPLIQAVDMVMESKITDSLSVAGILLAARLKQV